MAENVATRFLEDAGFSVICRNFQRKWGEIDIIAEKDSVVHFFEVKSLDYSYLSNQGHVPEENVHGLKRRKIGRMIETYFHESGHVSKGCDHGNREQLLTTTPVELPVFKFHVISIYLDLNKRKSRIIWLKDIVL